MDIQHINLKRAVAAIMAGMLVMVMYSLPLAADDLAKLDQLYAELAQAESEQARKIAKEIDLELTKSGSPAMDLLLKRGQDALNKGDFQAAIGHLTALTDHAPDFAEGWHARSLAYAKMGLFGPALADLERALALRPRHMRAIYGLGVIFEELGQPEKALEAYSRLQAIDPNYEGLTPAIERVSRALGGEDI
jgi:tetratricopeptide (TPR) repeat protein